MDNDLLLEPAEMPLDLPAAVGQNLLWLAGSVERMLGQRLTNSSSSSHAYWR